MKRVMDLLLVIPGLMMLSPLLLVTSALVWASLGRPIVFQQTRPGIHGRPFKLYKFRTMTSARGLDGAPLPDNLRLTRVGQFLRATTLDELPELFNVLKGDMSVVGPRPLLMSYLDRYTVEQARRHEIKPGLTGWAVVNGRNALSWEEKLRLDVWYVDHWTFWLDIEILFKTVALIFRRKGVSAEGHATMPEFMGPAVKK